MVGSILAKTTGRINSRDSSNKTNVIYTGNPINAKMLINKIKTRIAEIILYSIVSYMTGNAFERDGTIRPHTHPNSDDNANFGNSVAISEDFIIVGAPRGDQDDKENVQFTGQGYIEVFQITPYGIKKYTTGNAFETDGTIRPHTHPESDDNALFGASVAISKDFIIVGAPTRDRLEVMTGVESADLGQGYIEVFQITPYGIKKYTAGNAFERDDGTIRPHTHPNSDDSAVFGFSVAISEDFIIVGAPFGDHNDVETGAGAGQGYIEVFQITPYGIKKYTAGNAFERDDGTIRPHTHPNSDDNALFGWSVAISKDFIIVGAPYGDHNDVGLFAGQGYIEVFQITPYGIKKYTAGNAFERDDGTIRPHTHPNSDDNALFGLSVAISEDFIIVGAPFGDHNDVETGLGQGYIEVFQITPYGIKKYTAGNAFERDGTIRPHTHPKSNDYALFGFSVAISEDFIIVGAPFGDHNDVFGGVGEGEGYIEVFQITPYGIKKCITGNVFETDDGTIRPHTHPNSDDNALFGFSVAISEDFIIVGAPYGDHNDVDRGLVGQGYIETFKIKKTPTFNT